MKTAPNLSMEKYRKKEFIGEGAYGKVFKIEDRRTDEIYAAKIINFQNIPAALIENEISNLSMINYPTVVHFIGYSLKGFDGDPSPTVVTDFLTGGSLDKILEKERTGNSPVNWSATSRYIILFGLSIGMNHLHKVKIIHRDLKPANILLNENHYPVICDFGFSKSSDKRLSQFKLHTDLGTPFYRAPEILTGSYDFKIDIYSFSLVAFELITLKEPPFDLLNCLAEINGKENQKFIKRCYSRRPEKRPTFYEICDFITKKSFTECFGEIDLIEMLNFFDFLDENDANLDGDELYFIGRFWLEHNKSEAEHYMKKSAEKGKIDAMLAYAEMLDKGEGVRVDKEKAQHYYKMASDSRHKAERKKKHKKSAKSKKEALPIEPEKHKSPDGMKIKKKTSKKSPVMRASPGAGDDHNDAKPPNIMMGRRFPPFGEPEEHKSPDDTRRKIATLKRASASPGTGDAHKCASPPDFMMGRRFPPFDEPEKHKSPDIVPVADAAPPKVKVPTKSPPRKPKPNVSRPILVVDITRTKTMPKNDESAPKISKNSTIFRSVDYIVYILDEPSLTAEITYSPEAKGDVFIKAFVSFNGNEYKVIGIRDKAFYGASIKSLSFSENSYVKSIGASCFLNSTIESFSIPKSLTEFDNEWCNGADKLNKVEVDPRNTKIFAFFSMLFVQDEGKLIFAPRDSEGEIMIPDELTYIGVCCFQNANDIRSLISVNSSLEVIDSYAFYGCRNLEKASIKSDKLTVKKSCFAFSNKLTSVEFNCKHLSLHHRCFENCSSLNSISFLNLEDITLQSYVFNECNSLSKVNINSGSLIKLDDKSFFGQSSIKSIRLSAQSIEYPNNFEIKCNSLIEIWFESKKGLVLSQSMFYRLQQLKSVKIKTEGTIKMKQFCFVDMNNLETVEVTGDEIEMETYCFYNCSSLSTFILQSNKQITLDSQNIFNTYKSLRKIELTSSSSLTIDDYFLENAASLTDVRLSGQGLTIKANCFSGCQKLANFSIIKTGDISIQQNQFINCKKLDKITIEINNSDHLESKVDFGVDCFSRANDLKEIIISGNIITANFHGDSDETKFFAFVRNKDIASYFKE